MMAVTGSKPAEEALKLKSSSVPSITDVPEIEDAQGLKRVPPLQTKPMDQNGPYFG